MTHLSMTFPAGDSTQLDLDGLLYIGGVGAPFAPLTVPPVLWTGALRQGYVGCMRDLVINGHPVDIAGYAQQQDSGKEIKFFSDYSGR
jgi:leucine-rich repeat transmembrane neuronal protein 1/2